MAARLDGDEFAVALVQAGRDGAAVSERREVSDEGQLRSADDAMYRAKRAGKNRLVMDAS